MIINTYNETTKKYNENQSIESSWVSFFLLKNVYIKPEKKKYFKTIHFVIIKFFIVYQKKG